MTTTKTNPPQMFDHLLEPIKGWFHMGALDKDVTPFDANDPALRSGRVGYLDPSSSQLKPGLAADAMPLFMFPGGLDYDVYRDAGGIGGGRMMVLVASGSFELQSTEFVAGLYVPNVPLTAINTPGVDLGKLAVGTFYTDTICGVCSDGQLTNENGKAVVQFWSFFLPHKP